MKLTSQELMTREELINTCRMAYKHALDECAERAGKEMFGNGYETDRRLSKEEQFELGQRLATIWHESGGISPELILPGDT